MICCCSLAGTTACENCSRRASWNSSWDSSWTSNHSYLRKFGTPEDSMSVEIEKIEESQKRDCTNCKFGEPGASFTPCKNCSFGYTNWKPKTEKGADDE